MSSSRRFGSVVVAVTCALLTACTTTPTAVPSPSPRPASTTPEPRPTTPPTTPTSTPTPSPDVRAPAGFVVVSDVDPSIGQDIRYATAHNFVGRPVDGYLEPLCILTRATADALHRAQSAALAQGYSLKAYDCYRPQRAVDQFVRWAKDLSDQTMKAEFYPDENKAQLFHDGYIGAPTPHSQGITLDLTAVPRASAGQRPFVPGEPLLSCTAPPDQRFPDSSVNMGTGFDCFDPRAHTADSRITGAARTNRSRLLKWMTDAGFVNYTGEWWHFTLANAHAPAVYYNFPVSRAALT